MVDHSNSNLDRVEALIDRGCLIEASRMLDARRIADSNNTRELVLLARLYCLRGRIAEARGLLDRVLEVDAGNVQAIIERARLAVRLGDYAGANEWFAHAQERGASSDDWLVDWIDVLLRLGQYSAARNIATVRCERTPGDAGPWFRLGLAHQQARHLLQALDAYHRAARIDPELPMLRNNMAAAYLELEQYGQARELLEQALHDNPDNALAWTNLATTLLKTGAVHDGLVAAERSCALAPSYAAALQTYSYALREHQCWDAALAAAERSLQLEPDNQSIVWTVAMLQLIRGDYENGWLKHEARWAGSPELRDRAHNLPAPQWTGETLAGKKVFLWGEQGHGDVLQFVRFVPAFAEYVRREGGEVVYCTFATLAPLVERSLSGIVQTVIAHDQRPLPDFDYHLPLCSVPLALGIRVEHLPGRTGYLKADPAKVKSWRSRMSSTAKLRVGLAWTGSRTHQRNAMRSVSVVEYAKAFRSFADVDFYCLQVDAESDVAAARATGLRLIDYTAEFESFDDAAALVRSLDLVITVCTSVAHLAGGMGVPAWVLLDVNPHWVWMTGRMDSPWYPSARLYRQREYGDWYPVLAALQRDLTALSHAYDAPGSEREAGVIDERKAGLLAAQ